MAHFVVKHPPPSSSNNYKNDDDNDNNDDDDDIKHNHNVNNMRNDRSRLSLSDTDSNQIINTSPQQQHQQQHKPSPSAIPTPIKPTPTIRKIKKFVRCDKRTHMNLQTTTSYDHDKLGIVILKGSLPSNRVIYIKKMATYSVNYCDQKNCNKLLLAIIPKHSEMNPFNFQSIACFTQYIINNNFIKFRNQGVTQTKHVSLWRMYKFEGEVTLFNVWCIIKSFEQTLGINSNDYNSYHHKRKKNKTKNYHLAAYQSQQRRIDHLSEDILKRIFSFLNGSQYHCWLHIHEVIDHSHHRSNIVGLEYDANTRNVYVMQRSPALLKKIRQFGDKHYSKKNEHGGGAKLSDAFWKRSVEMFKAVY